MNRTHSFLFGRAALFVPVLGVALLAASCTDPVYDQQIEDLGDEAPGVDPGPEHRPGQPCVLCHSSTGPADDAPFSMAGTVFESPASIRGVPGVEVLLVDANGVSPVDANSGQRIPIITNKAGNFYVPTSVWNPAFPVRVAIFCSGALVNGPDGQPVQCGFPGQRKQMQSHIGREPSCAGCHYDAGRVGADGGTRVNPLKALSAVGHIYMTSQ